MWRIIRTDYLSIKLIGKFVCLFLLPKHIFQCNRKGASVMEIPCRVSPIGPTSKVRIGKFFMPASIPPYRFQTA